MNMNKRIELENKLMEMKNFLRRIILDEDFRRTEECLITQAQFLMKSINDYHEEVISIKD